MLKNKKDSAGIYLKFVMLTILYSLSLFVLQLSISYLLLKIDLKYIVFSYPISLFIIFILIFKHKNLQLNIAEGFSKNISYLYLIIIPIIYNRLGYFLSGLFYKSQEELNFNLYNEINLVISYLILSPIVEEIIFRGIILNDLLSNFKNKIVSIIFTSLLFCLIHIDGFEFYNIVRIIDAFIFSIIISCFYVKTKNIYYAIIFHFIYNLTWYIWRII